MPIVEQLLSDPERERGASRTQFGYVSNQRDRQLLVIDLSALPDLKVIDRNPLPASPTRWSSTVRANGYLLPEDNTDTIAVISTAANNYIYG